MPDPSTTTETWMERVDAWRASGEHAEAFSRPRGYAASTLRWWASKLKRELAAPSPPVPRPEIRLAKIVRAAPPAVPAPSRADAAIVLDLGPAGIRIGIGAGADRATLTMVLDVLGVGAAR